MSISTCKICSFTKISTIYEGTIRMGKPEDISTKKYKVFVCEKCKVSALPSIIEDSNKFYQSDEYRKQIGQSNEMEVYEKRHDPEVSSYFEMMPLAEFRGKIVADLGCGAGSFLDAIKGFAKTTIGVEMNIDFVKWLNEKGHIGTDSILEYNKNNPLSIDIATSHSVIEHLSDPLSFVKDIHTALKPGGKVLLSTPNQEGFLMKNGPEEFKSFFYRKVHTFYFNPQSLKNMVEIAGFKNVQIKTIQNYGLSNSLLWLRDRKGSGYSNILNDELLDYSWKKFLESNLLADRVYCIAEK